jgi:prepilin peptidase CpaA
MSVNQFLNELLFACFFALVIYAALKDISAYRIPNMVCLGIVALFPAHMLVSPPPADWFGSLAAGGAVFLVGFALFARGLLGAGDVKLLAATALWAGKSLILSELAVMALAGGVMASGVMLVQIVRRYRAVGLIGVLLPQMAVAGKTENRSAAQPKLPYGVAIGAGALYAGLMLMPA